MADPIVAECALCPRELNEKQAEDAWCPVCRAHICDWCDEGTAPADHDEPEAHAPEEEEA